MYLRRLVILVYFSVLIQGINAQFITYGTIEPVDQSYMDVSFSEFISSLKTALSNKDAEFVYDMLDDSIHYSFGGDDPGKIDFRRVWQLDNQNSEFWEAFSSTLNLGIVKCSDNCDYNEFVFPYYQASGLFKDLDDAFSVLIITVSDARVYSAPEKNSQVLTTLSYKAISFLEYQDGWFNALNGWFKISWKNNKKAYIKDTDARRLVGFRGGFKKKDNEWKLVYFVEGD